MSDMVDAELAVRQYLTFVEDPDKLVDPAEITRLEKEAAAAGDPLAKLRAIGALEKARSVDGAAYRADFVAHAKGWATQEGVPVVAFSRLGVPDDVLADAGLLPGGRGTRRGRSRRRVEDGTVRQRAKAVPVETIKTKVPEGRFTVRQLEELSGGSPATVRKALAEMIKDGQLEELGAATDWTGRGRAPIVYQKPS
ncbi:MAG: hypothetical protein GEV08_21010 [Acidimicrobiia bacterium]|nr:hypothetical protein [Acidimicrobiia bacterium]